MASPCKRKRSAFLFYSNDIKTNLMTQGESGIPRTVVTNSVSLFIVRDIPLSKIEGWCINIYGASHRPLDRYLRIGLSL